MNHPTDILAAINHTEESPTKDKLTSIEVCIIRNRDGSIRWLWPNGLRRPLFLKFYNVQGWKARLYSTILRILFILGVQRWFFERVTATLPTVGDGAVYDLQGLNWSLFTGTVGPNQKYILYTQAENGKGQFTKIAVTNKAAQLIAQEASTLELLADSSIKGWHYPGIAHQDDRSLSVYEHVGYTRRTSAYTPGHQRALASLADMEARTLVFDDWARSLRISERISNLAGGTTKIPYGIINKLSHLVTQLQGSTLDVHLAHGDFTPWNIYCNADGSLYIYDWELSNNTLPSGFDFFHYFIQKGTISEHKSWATIKAEIDDHGLSYFNKRDSGHYLSLYLLSNILYYLELYAQQEAWHTQIYWLIDTWNAALSDVLRSSISERELVILDLFDSIHDTDYAGLKLPTSQHEKISAYSDIDLLLSKRNSKSLVGRLKNHPLVDHTTISSGYAMTKITLVTKSRGILSLDLIHQLKRKHLVYMDVDAMIQGHWTNCNGIKHVNAADTRQFISLFYGLNGQATPAKYRTGQVEVTDSIALNNVLDQQQVPSIDQQKALIQVVSKMAANKSINRLKNILAYCYDTVIHSLSHRGMIITFSGVDGAGKSTIIEKTKYEVEKKLRKDVVVIRHRPSILPILSAWTKGKAAAEKAAADRLPRQGGNTSLLSSLLRFSYYYTDYLFGQFYINIKYVFRGKVVLYDRYYFDFINDTLRSNIVLPKWLTKSAFVFLLQPHLNFFLYADAQVILSRKQELDATTIRKLTIDYLQLFGQLAQKRPSQYHAIENISLQQTLDTIVHKIQLKLL